MISSLHRNECMNDETKWSRDKTRLGICLPDRASIFFRASLFTLPLPFQSWTQARSRREWERPSMVSWNTSTSRRRRWEMSSLDRPEHVVLLFITYEEKCARVLPSTPLNLQLLGATVGNSNIIMLFCFYSKFYLLSLFFYFFHPQWICTNTKTH